MTDAVNSEPTARQGFGGGLQGGDKIIKLNYNDQQESFVTN